MTDNSKTLTSVIAGCATLVACFALMADCSKRVAEVEADPKRACIEGGGYWSELGAAPHEIGRCRREP